MKAIVYEKYGSPDVLEFKEVEKPSPKENEVLIKVHAASLNRGDLPTLRGKPFLFRLMNGLRGPKHNILGDDIAGTVEAVGRNVTQFQPGDEVFGMSNFGAFAEYRCVTEYNEPNQSMILKPSSLSFEEAAAIPIAAITALQGLRDKGQIQSGQSVLINGASGGVGTFAVQIAKHLGAEVTGVCSTNKMDMVRSIGADHVISYLEEDFTKSGEQYDLILDVAAYRSIFNYKRSLSSNGIYVCTGGSTGKFFQAYFFGPLVSLRGNKKLGSAGIAKPTQEDFLYLIELFEAGKVVPVIDRSYPLSEVAEALQYLEEGKAQGKVVITVAKE
ncbi:MAG: NAD(P)-dependent alcohol dehydrogenase [Candidatus Thorarchaeota archaeon]|jgi:NADPH:quinone reductase-like Zn-dependent oxidoreductase